MTMMQQSVEHGADSRGITEQFALIFHRTSDYFSLAGFEVTTYGRFWVIPEV
jgi:hypothetical protein